MSYKVLSRKWRPQVFDEVVGQKHITHTLQNAIEMDRVAHGYIFSGPRGVGKTTTARILAKALNCENPLNKNPCSKCTNCKDITKGSSLDVQEFDGASNRGIDEIRELRESVKYPPNQSQYRIYIIDEVHMLTREAFNALLKTLEEPPPHIIFIMATTDSHKVPTTILSRTQKFDFKPISIEDISALLKKVLENEKIDYENESLNLIAQKADGSLRDSLSLLDQLIAYSNDKINLQTTKDILGIIEENVFLILTKLCHEKNITEIIKYINKLLDDGCSIVNFITGFNSFIRNCMLIKNQEKFQTNLSDNSVEWIKSNCQYNTKDLLQILDLSMKFESNIKNISQHQIALEVLFMKIACLDSSIKVSQILSKKNQINTPERNFDSKKSNKIKKNPVNEHTTSLDDSNSFQKKLPEEKNTLTLELIKEYWPEIINKLEKVNSKITNFLEEVTLSDFDGSLLSIELLNGHKFQQKTLEKDTVEIESILKKVLGEKIQLKFHIKNNFENKTNEKKQLEREHPLLEKVLEKFEGEIIR